MLRISKDLIPIASSVVTVAYALYWLTRHPFMEQTHHYITALVIVLWLASLPLFSLHRFLSERSNHHGTIQRFF